jgi:sulfatase maturation enzyme AslB (radical SAM superfamily)
MTKAAKRLAGEKLLLKAMKRNKKGKEVQWDAGEPLLCF